MCEFIYVIKSQCEGGGLTPDPHYLLIKTEGIKHDGRRYMTASPDLENFKTLQNGYIPKMIAKPIADWAKIGARKIHISYGEKGLTAIEVHFNSLLSSELVNTLKEIEWENHEELKSFKPID